MKLQRSAGRCKETKALRVGRSVSTNGRDLNGQVRWRDLGGSSVISRWLTRFNCGEAFAQRPRLSPQHVVCSPIAPMSPPASEGRQNRAQGDAQWSPGFTGLSTPQPPKGAAEGSAGPHVPRVPVAGRSRRVHGQHVTHGDAPPVHRAAGRASQEVLVE